MYPGLLFSPNVNTFWVISGVMSKTYVGCSGQRFALRCPDKTAPDITKATWGHQPGFKCPEEGPIDDTTMSCSEDVTDKVKERCNDRKCAMKPNKRKLASTCDGKNKEFIIKVDYTCKEPNTGNPSPRPTG